LSAKLFKEVPKPVLRDQSNALAKKSVRLTKRKTKLAIMLLILAVYGICIASLKGKLPNQTATLVITPGSRIQSLISKQAVTCVDLTLEHNTWDVTEESVTAYNSDGKLVVAGTYTNETLPLFTATQTKLELNFTKNPYLHAVVSSKPDTQLSFYVGWAGLNSSSAKEFLEGHSKVVTEIDETTGIAWINISYPQSGEKIDDKTHHITINVARRLARVDLDKQCFVGLQIRQYLIGFMPLDKCYETTIESLCLLSELPYNIASTEGKGQTLPDGSIVHIIKKDDIVNHLKDCLYLQRVYILYTMDAPQDTLYTIFLLSKHDENLTAVRAGFVFVHESRLNEIGTYVDWRTPVQLDYDFEPAATLFTTMDEGDYTIIFTPLKRDKLQEVQLHEVQFTFSKLPYSAFIFANINEEVLIVTSIFIVTIAGTLPTVLMFYLFYLYRKNKLEDSKNTIVKILIAGLALRLILAPVTAYADDTQVFAEIGALYFGSGVLGAQWVSLPGFVYLETASYFPYALLRAFGFQDFQFLALDIYSVEALFTKIPAILSDLGSFYYILKMAQKYAPKKKILLPALYLLNPLTVYVSGILGQFDPIFTFAIIASIYYLVAEYHILKATIFSSFAAILNPVGIATSIPLLANVSLRESRKTLAKSLLLATLIFSASMLPFFFEEKSPVVLTSYERLISGIPGEPFYGTQINFYAYGIYVASSVGYGLTFRFLLEILGFELGPMFYPYGAALIFLIFVGIFIYKIRKAYATGPHGLVYTGTFMLVVTSLFQLTFPTIFDQFVVWIAGLLLISYILSHNRKFLLIFTTISIATGFVYICTWRDYLPLISGVEAAPLGNPLLATLTSAFIGTLYSLLLLIIIIITLKMWMQKTTPSKVEKVLEQTRTH